MICIYTQLLLTALLTASACALPGSFLILRGTSFLTDALGHAILLGIVLSFFIVQQLHSPLIFLGATITGLTTVAIIEQLIKTKKIAADAAIGIVFPLLFSLAVLLINLYARGIHLDIDAVLLGELAFTPLHQITVCNIQIGSYALWIMLATLVFNLTAIILNYKAFNIATFDPCFAASLNFKPHTIHYAIMTMTCITIIAAFESAGAILVVAFMITAPATASLITYRLSHLLIASILFGMIGAVSGCIFAHIFNVSIAGSIATMNGAWFAITLLLRNKLKVS